jgi:hypothetical protein
MVAGNRDVYHTQERQRFTVPCADTPGAGLKTVFKHAGGIAGIAGDTKCGIKIKSPSHDAFSTPTLVL